MIIYKITNKLNGKIYVGLTTKSAQNRFLQHVKNSKKPRFSSIYFYKALTKYGEDNFTIEVLDSASSYEELYRKEQFWIEKLGANNKDIGYNCTKGGEGVLGLQRSEEYKKKRSDLLKGENNYFFGKSHSDETRKRMSEARKEYWRKKKELAVGEQ